MKKFFLRWCLFSLGLFVLLFFHAGGVDTMVIAISVVGGLVAPVLIEGGFY